MPQCTLNQRQMKCNPRQILRPLIKNKPGYWGGFGISVTGRVRYRSVGSVEVYGAPGRPKLRRIFGATLHEGEDFDLNTGPTWRRVVSAGKSWILRGLDGAAHWRKTKSTAERNWWNTYLWITLSSSRKTSEFIFAEVRNLEKNPAELYHTHIKPVGVPVGLRKNTKMSLEALQSVASARTEKTDTRMIRVECCPRWVAGMASQSFASSSTVLVARGGLVSTPEKREMQFEVMFNQT
ncbi:hypothetical protein B0H14DRAFT_2603105 [Mycena olivaceomarginata]|nr:hypothetical protein B0H14DRAFT_2603105 [Mycena olivaceomarginata]